MALPTEWIPKPARSAVLIVLSAVGVFWSGIKAVEWLEAKANAAAKAEVAPIAATVQRIADDVNEIKGDVKELRKERVVSPHGQR